ncbi:Pkinase-domain-containing protein [Schizophyllum fasciatum]
MAAAVLPTTLSVVNPFRASSRHGDSSTSTAGSARTDSSKPSSPEPHHKGFQRIRSSLEHSIRTATRSRKGAPVDSDEFATITQKSHKGKEKAVDEPKERSHMLRRLGSRVTIRRSGRDSTSPTRPPLPKEEKPSKEKLPKEPRESRKLTKGRHASNSVSFTPSLRMASISSPALHLSSQALPSPNSKSAIPASSSSGSDALVSPARERKRPAPLPLQRDVSFAPPATPTKRETRRSSGSYLQPTESSSRHRTTRSQPVNLPSSPSTPSLHHPRNATPTNETHLRQETPSPPPTPTPASGSRGMIRSNSRAARSSGNLPLRERSESPITPRTGSPIRARSPSTSTARTRIVPRGLSSNSASQLPLSPPSPLPQPRGSIDSQRRPSIDAPRRRRPSIGGSPIPMRGDSPIGVRPAISPNRRSVSQTRNLNVSTTSLASPPNPEQREAIRTATVMLCKEIGKPPVHGRSEQAIRDWDEVEHRTRALIRLERVWSKTPSTTNINGASALSSSGLSASGEERERRLFCECLRDGYVLCHLLNRLRQASVVKPDPREDGFVRTSNVTKFLAACSSWGLPSEDLFLRDDLIEATGESLARVAHTVTALIRFSEDPATARSKLLTGKRPSLHVSTNTPYGSGTVRGAAASSPNLTTPASPTKKRYSPPAGLPTLRSISPSSSGHSTGALEEPPVGQAREPREHNAGDADRLAAPAPPPRSPLRSRSGRRDDAGLANWALNAMSPARSSVADSTRATIGDGASVRESVAPDASVRQSMASTAQSETTVTTAASSLMEAGRTNSGGGRFGTIRTITTEATSESPSLTRAEGGAVAEDMRKRDRSGRERVLSDSPVVDLSRVEEADELGSTRAPQKGKAREEGDKPPLRLGKGKWPDDFIDAIGQQRAGPRSPLPDSDPPPSPLSSSPGGPRKLAIVGAARRNDSVESLQPFPRRPSHRSRHSIDTAGPSALLPKEAVLRRDISPDPLSSKIMLRRHSTKQGRRSGSLVPRVSLDEPRSLDAEAPPMVPFPRTPSGEHKMLQLGEADAGPSSVPDRPRPLRGRFQSDIESTAVRQRPRPSSYDELGAKPARSRFESMVNLGASKDASASDLMTRESVHSAGSAVRKTLVIKDDGKLPTHFQLGNCIGRGQFGSVYRALNLNTGQMVAVKRIRLEGLKEDEISTLMREVDLVKSLSHPSIVKYEGMARDDDSLSIVLEYAENGSLVHTLKAFGKLNERLVANYVVKILEGLHYLHQNDVVHCDLKAANILTTKTGNVKLSDFGVSLNLRAMEREIKDVAGTPNWMAPEVIELKGASTKSDIWSLACTVIELFTGKPPYSDVANSMSVMFRIVEDKMPPLPENCSPLLEEFLKLCFNKEPTLRPSADILFEHAWLKQNWGAHKELRPQDSIPFLRRVSTDLQKSEAVRLLAQVEMPDRSSDKSVKGEDPVSSSPPRRRMSSQSVRPPESNMSPREHSFVKTTFSKPMVCRVCLLNVKKSAVLCSECSLIAHAKCAKDAPPTCDLRAQLLLYAQYAEKGNPGSVYQNPVDIIGEHPGSPMSDVAFVARSPRSSIDTPSANPPASPPPSQDLLHPPTAFKFVHAFKHKGKSTQSQPDSGQSSSSNVRTKSQQNLHKDVHERERPLSLKSTSTQATYSMRSTGDTVSSNGRSIHPVPENDVGTYGSHQSTPSGVESEAADAIPGSLPTEGRSRHKRRGESKSSGQCVIQ